MPKCVELGWWPNFHISQFEKGIWKRLFVESILDLRNGRTPLGVSISRYLLIVSFTNKVGPLLVCSNYPFSDISR